MPEPRQAAAMQHWGSHPSCSAPTIAVSAAVEAAEAMRPLQEMPLPHAGLLCCAGQTKRRCAAKKIVYASGLLPAARSAAGTPEVLSNEKARLSSGFERLQPPWPCLCKLPDAAVFPPAHFDLQAAVHVEY